MATATVKNIPDDLYEQLKTAARAHRRSINNELINFAWKRYGNPER